MSKESVESSVRPLVRPPIRRPAPKKRPIRYFLPDQILLHMKHPPETNPFAALKAFLDKKTQGEEWKSRIRLPKTVAGDDPILTFPVTDDAGRSFSIVHGELISQNALLEVLKQIGDQPLKITDEITLQSSSPNWLVGGTSEGSGSGGPGSWPVEADPPIDDSWMFQFVSGTNASPLTGSSEQGKGVHIAILDTAPSQHARDRAYSDWHWGHPLINSLLGPNNPLQVYSAEYEELYQLQAYDMVGHHYLMRDHGLFIAGIIRTIVSKARLYLYEVLNPYGVGTIESIARGLLKVLQNPEIKAGEPLIINCSFMLDMPVKGAFDPDLPIEFRDADFFNQTSMSTREIFDALLNRKNTTVVAAAGNDSKHNNANNNGTRPNTRYPAAFEHVVGVGALPKRLLGDTDPYRAATYSNLSDVPPLKSYITLGGEPGRENGVLGVYIGDFPEYVEPEGCLGFLLRLLNLTNLPQPGVLSNNIFTMRPEYTRYKPNTTGWAWWAGTSFAAPIVSAVLAGKYDRTGDIGTEIQGILDALFQTNKDETPEDEKVIPIHQG